MYVRRPERRLDRDRGGGWNSSRSRTGNRPRGRLAVPLAALAATLLVSAGPAKAGTGYGQLIVNPGTAAPGQSVSILGTCPNNGTGLRGVYSSAFVGGSASVTQSQINFSGSATIMSSASGQYTVTADCGTGSPSVTITVSGAVATPSMPAPTTQPPMPTSMPSVVHTSPVAVMPPPSTKSGMGGYTHAPTHSAPPMAGGMGASASAGMGMGATASGTKQTTATPGAVAAGNGPVTSTGVVRVGLAGSSKNLMTTAGAATVAVAVVLAAGTGFVMIRRRRRDTSGTHY